MTDLSRFHATDPATHARALAEVALGQKETHWMWFVFPQLAILGHSPTAKHYGLAPQEAPAFLADPVLGGRLVDLCRTLMRHAGRLTARDIFGDVDALKLCSSMTLFAAVPGADPVFAAVLAAFCKGPCERTRAVLVQR